MPRSRVGSNLVDLNLLLTNNAPLSWDDRRSLLYMVETDFKDVSQVKDIFTQLENSDYKNQIRSQGLEVVNKRFSSNDYKTQEIITALNLN